MRTMIFTVVKLTILKVESAADIIPRSCQGLFSGTGTGFGVVEMGGVQEMDDNKRGDMPIIVMFLQNCTQKAAKNKKKQQASPCKQEE